MLNQRESNPSPYPQGALATGIAGAVIPLVNTSAESAIPIQHREGSIWGGRFWDPNWVSEIGTRDPGSGIPNPMDEGLETLRHEEHITDNQGIHLCIPRGHSHRGCAR